MDKRYFSEKIVKWYQINGRSLPWRETIEPYKIWLSEIILQQTRVSQGLPYYEAFIKKYPTVQSLASAPEKDVLRLWQGLGYYSRARNLHRCAQFIVKNFNGNFPKTYNELLTLPGVGEYTAAAIASFCFKEKVAVVDGNVFRVLARVFGIETPINSTQGKKEFAKLANDLIPAEQPDQHNQAIMEFGAVFCTPKNPDCSSCVFVRSCVANLHEMQVSLPGKVKARKSKRRYFYYFVFENKNTLMMRERREKDIWNGLYDFHLIEKSRPVRPELILSENQGNTGNKGITDYVVTKTYKHVLTHQTIFSRFIIVKNNSKSIPKNQNSAFYSLKEISDLPKPVLVSRFLSDHYFL